ncbi:carboxypeptidase M32 [Telmatocola sphagniphila]|uniref:Metal-dependent carboxypeptidase n=1 Tax=Telmatocola sphagniphila TaxID=1123043 RepID=A0A8E6EVT3_9BACT|nr:carboxypeptidase M32 [Telmatocola sphagniphila]QVL33022.1 carboxypeptidase M32 [Telmatocola sphagniphila]
MSKDPKYQELINLVREANLLASCGSLLGWDERTYLPSKGSEFRGEQVGLIARLSHQMNTNPRVGELLANVEGRLMPAVDLPEQANIREIRRSYDRATKLPARLVEEMAKITTQAQGAWSQARQENDYPAFKPWLDKILVLKREETQAIGFKNHPYDALLDEYEPGCSSTEIREIFAGLVKELTPLLKRIQGASAKPRTEILHRSFPIEAQKEFGRKTAAKIGFDFEAGRLDTTTHPFCSGIGPGDCRITTRYNANFFNESFFGTLHEAGHGIYEQNLPAADFGTPLGSYCSLGIHESQSRLWENQIGRSRPFWEHFYPQAKELFSSLSDVPLEDFFFAINEVKPSLIRVEADEVTYNLHIALRFELEMDLLKGDLSTADLPETWNQKFQSYFGIQPPDSKTGCLQDIHWSMGGIGYFPTYTLGNLYAAQFMVQARKVMPLLDREISQGEFGSLKQWLVTHVHSHGRRYTPDVLCRKITGQALTHKPFLEYLNEKFSHLYRLM